MITLRNACGRQARVSATYVQGTPVIGEGQLRRAEAAVGGGRLVAVNAESPVLVIDSAGNIVATIATGGAR